MFSAFCGVTAQPSLFGPSSAGQCMKSRSSSSLMRERPRRPNSKGTCQCQCCLVTEPDFVRHFDYSIYQRAHASQKNEGAPDSQNHRLGTQDRPEKRTSSLLTPQGTTRKGDE